MHVTVFSSPRRCPHRPNTQHGRPLTAKLFPPSQKNKTYLLGPANHLAKGPPLTEALLKGGEKLLLECFSEKLYSPPRHLSLRAFVYEAWVYRCVKSVSQALFRKP